MRDPQYDEIKPLKMLLEGAGKPCTIPGCNEPLTIMQGPGQHKYCRKHQLQLHEYGGMGRGDKPHTLHRSYVCKHCGFDASQHPDVLAESNPVERNRLMRSVMQGDHIIRKADGGDDSEENINCLCGNCHLIKTAKEKDYRKGKLNENRDK